MTTFKYYATWNGVGDEHKFYTERAAIKHLESKEETRGRGRLFREEWDDVGLLSTVEILLSQAALEKRIGKDNGMDPDAVLAMLHDCIEEAAGKCQELQTWLQQGGFHPDWTKQPMAEAYFHLWQTALRAKAEKRDVLFTNPDSN